MAEITDYTRRYLAVMRIRDLAVAHHRHIPVKPIVDLDELAESLSVSEVHDVTQCSDTHIKQMVTLCLMDETYRRPRVHRRAEGVVDRVVRGVFA